MQLPFYNKYCKFNQSYYNTQSLMFLNNIFDENSEKLTLEKLAELPGISLPNLHFPIKKPHETVECSLIESYTKEQRDFLISEFTKFPNLVSQFSYDVGQIKDVNGKPILIDIPLITELPKMTKAYSLSKEESASLNDILNF